MNAGVKDKLTFSSRNVWAKLRPSAVHFNARKVQNTRLVVGAVNKRRIGTFKRTQNFSTEDFDVLKGDEFLGAAECSGFCPGK
jgi:hypothetical protein